MKCQLILSNQQLIHLLELLGYEVTLSEEVQYRCYLDQSIEPFIRSTLKVRLKDHRLPPSAPKAVPDFSSFLFN